VKVAVIGRPNVGKSSLFNKLISKRKAVVDDIPGVTRDRLEEKVEHYGKVFTLIDTGGYELKDTHIEDHILEQIDIAIQEANLLLFVVDGKTGLHPMDYDIAKRLRKSDKKLILLVNKVDNDKRDFSEFYSLGIKPVLSCSVSHSLGIGDLLDEIIKHESIKACEEKEEDLVRIAISGRPNTGKSTLLNAMIKEKRAVVSSKPGTTRDVVDIKLKNKFGEFLVLDTAGIRKVSKTESRIEEYSIIRTKKAIERSDIALLVIDGVDGVTTQDKKVSKIIEDSGTACIILINKKDKMEKLMKKKDIDFYLPYLKYAPSVNVSAKYEKDFDKIFKLINEIMDYRKKKITTGELNRFFQKIIDYKTPPLKAGKEIRLKYIVQVHKTRGAVPKFIVFANFPKDVHESYKRYIVRKLREEYNFMGSPIKLIFKKGS
jgi:GTPase